MGAGGQRGGGSRYRRPPITVHGGYMEDWRRGPEASPATRKRFMTWRHDSMTRGILRRRGYKGRQGDGHALLIEGPCTQATLAQQLHREGLETPAPVSLAKRPPRIPRSRQPAGPQDSSNEAQERRSAPPPQSTARRLLEGLQNKRRLAVEAGRDADLYRACCGGLERG